MLRPVTPSTEGDLRRRLQMICNTLASGEANEKACYEAIDFLTKRLDEMRPGTAPTVKPRDQKCKTRSSLPLSH
jgi:hypothetical protein